MGSLEVARNKKQELGRMQQQQQQKQAWSSSSSSRSGRCKRHPHQGLIGVCSLCLKERLLALAIELEEDEAAAGADNEELQYLRALDGAPPAHPCSNSASDSVNPRLLASQLQRYHNHLALHHHNTLQLQPARRSHIHCPDKPPASHSTSRKHKSVSSSPRHSSGLAQHPHLHAVVVDRHAPFSPPFAPASRNSQPQVLHWRKQPNAVSPLSLSGLNHFISAVKDQRAEEPKPKKKKSSSLWSLLQKQVPPHEGDHGLMTKGSLQGSPTYNAGGFRGGRPDSNSMREVHASLCRGDASSLLSSPRGLVSGGQLPSARPKLPSHGRVALQHQGGHWRSSSTVDDILADADTRVESEGDGVSPSWISSLFHRRGRTRSKSISTACNSSPDLNAVMTASAAAKYGRFSVDAAAPSSSRISDASKREARFRRKYASLFEETGSATSSKKRADGALPEDKAEEHCLQCQADADAQSQQMKLASFLANRGNESGDGGAKLKHRAEGLPLPPKAPPLAYTNMKPASPGKKPSSTQVSACVSSETMLSTLGRDSEAANTPLSPGVYRLSGRSRSPHANALVYSGVPKGAVAASYLMSSKHSTIAKKEGSATSNAASPLDTHASSLSSIAASTTADGLDSELDMEKPSSAYPCSRSWSKNWNKAILSPILSFKGKAQHSSSSSRKRSGAFNGGNDRGAASMPQSKGEQERRRVDRDAVEMDAAEKQAAAQHYSFLSKDYSAFSFYFSPLRRSRRKAAVEVAGSSGGNCMSSARVNASDEAGIPITSMQISSRHSVDGSCRPSISGRAHH